MAAVTSIVAAASLAAGIGGSVLSARAAKKQRKAEQKAQEAAQKAAAEAAQKASNTEALAQENAAEEDLAAFTLGAPGASDSLFRQTRRKAASTSSPATGRSAGGL